MSNCHLVAGRSLIDLAASRLALRTPALRAATALTRPSRSAQRLPCGRYVLPTAKTAGPNDVVANHCVEHGDHLTHHRHDHELRSDRKGPGSNHVDGEVKLRRTDSNRRAAEYVDKILR